MKTQKRENKLFHRCFEGRYSKIGMCINHDVTSGCLQRYIAIVIDWDVHV